MMKQLRNPGQVQFPLQTQKLIVATVTVSLDSNGPRISPLIYGVNNEHDPARLRQLGATVNRLGGTPWSTLNGPIRAINAGNDYYFHNYDSIAGVPVDPVGFHQRTASAGGTTMLTVPLLDKVAKDTKSYAFSVRKYGAQANVLEGDAGDGIKPGGNSWQGPFVTGNNPSDAYLPNSPSHQEAWLKSLPKNVPFFGLDNEPMLWHTSHRAAHPEGARMQEVIAATKAYAAKVRSVLPSAALLGPEEWNYEGCLISGFDHQNAGKNSYNPANYGDRKANGNQDWIPVYVKAMKDHYAQTGQRLIDYLSVHFYPHNTQYATLLEDPSDTPAMRDFRLKSTKSLWDPSFVSSDYISQLHPNYGIERRNIRLVSRLKEWAAAFPGTKTAITEYSFGPDNLLASALAQVEALGVFGREGLDMACRWPSPEPSSPVGLAFRLFRNFDGQGRQFGSLLQKLTVSGVSADHLSVFAALNEKRNGLTLVLLNKSQTESGKTQVSLAGVNSAFQPSLFVRPPFVLGATAYRLESDGSPSGARLVTVSGVGVVKNNQLFLDLPPFSAMLVHVFPQAKRPPIGLGSARPEILR